jgi:hypothetical protein
MCGWVKQKGFQVREVRLGRYGAPTFFGGIGGALGIESGIGSARTGILLGNL